MIAISGCYQYSMADRASGCFSGESEAVTEYDSTTSDASPLWDYYKYSSHLSARGARAVTTKSE